MIKFRSIGHTKPRMTEAERMEERFLREAEEDMMGRMKGILLMLIGATLISVVFLVMEMTGI